MSDLESSSSSSSSEDDGENIDDSSESDSSSSSSSGSDREESPQNDNKSWVLSKNSPEHVSPQRNHFEQENDADEKSGDEKFDIRPSRRGPKEDLRLLWESNPQVYGVRRSSRARKEPERLTVLQESDESGGNRRRGTKRHRQEDFTVTLTDTESDSGSEFESATASRRRGTVKSSRMSKLTQMRARLQGKKKGGGKKVRRQTYDTDETSSDEDGRPKRSSTRTQNSKISYKESSQDETDSDDVVEVVEKEEEVDNSECIDKVMDDRVGKPEAVGSVTTWYAVNANGDPNESYDPNNSDGVQQYLISWKGWSHLHNTWESEKSLKEQKVRGIKKLENYIKKKDEVDAWLKVASPEDAEYYLCQQELSRDLVTTYRKVERVIAKSRQKNRSGFWDYQVKWNGLPYGECTWEDGELINKYFSEDVEKFEQRQDNANVPKRDAKKHPPTKFVPLKSSPDWLQGDKGYSLRDYQVDGVNWLANSWTRNNSVILADEMGLGKTIQSITFLSYLYHFHNVYGPFLIIVPLSTIASWQHEFQTWANFMNIIMYVGDARSRQLIRDVEWVFPNKKLKFNVVLTTYEILLKEKSFLGSHTWAVIAVDEAHRLKNEDSLLYKSLIEFRSHHRLLITGTPLQNSLKELWSLLHFIMPEKFDSWLEFEERHSGERETGYTSLHKILQPFLLRRVKKDVEKSLPAKVERILRVEMSSIQKQYYRWILTKNYQELSKGNKGKVSSFCNIVMELKKCCNHAFLTRTDGKIPVNNEERLQNLIRSSGKMILLDKLLKRLREGGHRVLIFSQMVRMLDLLQDYLIMNRIGFQRLDGSIKGEIRRQALERFNAPGSEDFCFLLSTRAGGLGINLASADTVIIFDSDWNPQNDLQAQARAHRIGQTNQVNIYRLVCVGSVEEDIIERAKRKMVLDHLVIQRMDTSGKTVLSKNNAPSATTGNPFNKEELSAILKFGAEDLFKEAEADEMEPECDIDEILRRAETTEEQTESGSELLSAFKFATFTFDEDEDTVQSSVKNDEEDSRSGQKDWDEIIPEADRKKIEEEERKKQEAKLYLPPRNRKSLKMGAGASGSDAGSDESDDSDEEDEENDTSTKKRGRARRGQKDAFPGFTTQEVRKFVKSFRKFGNPLERLDAIARDAELTIQSEADLRRLGQQLHTQLTETMQEFNNKLNGTNGENVPSQASKRGPSFRIGGASVSVKTTMACINDLKPLVDVMPKDSEERERFRLTVPVKPIRGWDCEWTSEDDSKLLIGIYEYGMGSWDQLQSDTVLGLEKKILRPNNEKPQAKQLQTRVEYLMKLLRKTQEIGRMPTGLKTNSAISAAASKVARNIMQGRKSPDKQDDTVSQSKKRSRKIKSKARVEIADDSDVADNGISKEQTVKKSRKIQKKRKVPKDENMNTAVKDDGKANKVKSRKIKRKEKSKKASTDNHVIEKKKSDTSRKSHKKSTGPVHITAASDPVPIGQDEFLGELNKETFIDCKERMRPVKKALKLLDKPPPDGSTGEKAQHEHMKKCVLEIGDRVNQCLCDFKDFETRKSWRRNLWIFVSQFTEYSAHELFKLFTKACRKRDESKRKIKKKNPAGGDSITPNSQSSTKSSKSLGDKAVKVSHDKKRAHSPVRNGPHADAKRSFNHRERQSHHHHHRKIESSYNERGNEGASFDHQPHAKQYRPEASGYQREQHWDGHRYGNEPPRFSRGPPPYHSWARHEDGVRYPKDDLRRRDYDNSRRYPRDYPHGVPPREDGRYGGHHRSQYPEHGPGPHDLDARRYQMESRRSNSPFHHNRSPVQPMQYSNPGHQSSGIHSPSSSRVRPNSPDPRTERDLLKRETVT